jgi:hypothetical protein
LLSGDHVDQLPASGHHGAQLLGVRIGQRPQRRSDGLAIVSQYLGINAISFGQAARGFGEASHQPRVNHDHRQFRSGQGGHQGSFQATGGFDHDEGGRELGELVHERFDLGVLIEDLPGLITGSQCDVQSSFGHINTDKQRRRFHLKLLSGRPALQDTGLVGPDNCSGSVR